MTSMVLRQLFDGHGVTVAPATSDESILSLDPAEVARIFAAENLVLFRGFATPIEAFKQFSEQLCTDFMTYEGGASARRAIGGDPTLMSVTEPSHTFAIPLHGEMYYAKHRPRILWFYCVRPASSGGETTAADGAAFCDALSTGTRTLFEDNRIRYICTHGDGRWQVLFGTNDPAAVRRYCEASDTSFAWNDRDRSVTTEYVSSALSDSQFGDRRVFINNVMTMTHWEAHGVRRRVVRLEDGSPIPTRVVAELQDLEAKMTLPVAWQPRDVLMVDNTRYLHGRRSFSDPGREICVRLSGGLRRQP
jgi:alpha-ketoglutarate-dependent taurine dioxygenase